MKIKDAVLNERYKITVTDTLTGELVSVIKFAKKETYRWEKVVSEMLADYLELSGSKKVRLLAWILTEKDSKNLIYGGYKSIADRSNVGIDLVRRTLPILIKKGFIKRVDVGILMVNPKMIRYGNDYVGGLMFKVWSE